MHEILELKVRRVLIVGSMGAGKTTFARALARLLDLTHHELDREYWGAHWQPLENGRFRARVAELAAGETWVIEGFDSRVGDLTWQRAELVVWLDVGLAVKFFRVVKRGLSRVWSGEELWNGNRESLARVFLGRESAVAWVFRSHRGREKIYAERLREQDSAGGYRLAVSGAGPGPRILRLHTLESQKLFTCPISSTSR